MILDGNSIKSEILENLREEVFSLNLKPKLVVIQVGNDEASNVYIRQKKRMCEFIGYEYELIKLDLDVKTEEILEIIERLNADDLVNGVLVQMPLPSQIDASLVQNAISSLKDVDGLNDINAGKLFHNKECLCPCTPYGVMELFKRYNISLSGKNAVVVGKSNLVGKPLSMMLLNEGATVSICHSKTKNLSEYTKNADILVVATGKPNLIDDTMVKEGVVVIDVGISRVNNSLCGDVKFSEVKDKSSYITPVPGGVGPMTVAMLAKNLLKAYKIQRM